MRQPITYADSRDDLPQSDFAKRLAELRIARTFEAANNNERSAPSHAQVVQLEAQCDALRIEKVSAVASSRPVFDTIMRELRAGDTFVVVDIDRAFRSAIDAILTATTLETRGVAFEILSFPMSTASAEGAFMYGVLALAAQFERGIIRRRTIEGLEAARKRGQRLGRPPRLPDTMIRDAHAWMVETDLPCRYVAALLGVSRLTLQRGFHRLGLAYPISNEPKGGEHAQSNL